MLTLKSNLAFLGARPTLTPALPNVANLVAPRAWRRVVSIDDDSHQLDWHYLPAPAPRRLPALTHSYSLGQVLDKGFFFPLPPVSPFAQLPTKQQVRAPALAPGAPRVFRGQTAKIRRHVKKKKPALGVVPLF